MKSLRAVARTPRSKNSVSQPRAAVPHEYGNARGHDWFTRSSECAAIPEATPIFRSDLGIVLSGTRDQRKLFFPELMCFASDHDTDHRVARISLSAPTGIFEVLDGASFVPQLLITGGIHDLDDPYYISNSKWRT